MLLFQIKYGLGGGFGGCCEWVTVEASSLEIAREQAYQAACEEYESYEGLHGIRGVYEIMEEDGLEEDEAVAAWQYERDGMIEYEARPLVEGDSMKLSDLQARLEGDD